MARIMRQVTVVRDGMHNAFTDLKYWQESYWVSYRKADTHASGCSASSATARSRSCSSRPPATVPTRG